MLLLIDLLHTHTCGFLGAIVKVNQPAAGIYHATQISEAETTATSLKAQSSQPEARINFGPLSFFGVLTVNIRSLFLVCNIWLLTPCY